MTSEDEPTPQGKFDRRPVPDPTFLTTQALDREISSIKEYIKQTSEMEDEKDGLLNRERTEQFKSLGELFAERIRGLTTLVEQKFDLIERQRVEQKKDTKDAVDAALTAQKEAVREQTAASERAIAKSETATNKLLEQLAQTFATANDSQRRSIDEVKERVGDVDKKVSGIEQQKVGAKEDRTSLYAMVGFMATLLLVTLAVLTFVIAHG